MTQWRAIEAAGSRIHVQAVDRLAEPRVFRRLAGAVFALALIVTWVVGDSALPLLLGMTCISGALIVADVFNYARHQSAQPEERTTPMIRDLEMVCFTCPGQNDIFAGVVPEPFEPIVIGCGYSWAPRYVLDRPQLGLVLFSLICMIPVVVSQWLGYRTLFAILIPVIIAHLGLIVLRPQHIRISPGRFEVLRGWRWKQQTVVFRSFALANARCIARLDRGYLVVEDHDGSVLLNAVQIRRPLREVAESLARAFLSWKYTVMEAKECEETET